MGLPRDVFQSLSVSSRNFYFCQVQEKEGVEFDPKDKAPLLSQMERLMREIDKHWGGGCYYAELHFQKYHMLQKYISGLQFAPCTPDAGCHKVRIEIALLSSPPKAAGARGF
jgi:hypothetical protein